MMIRAIRLKSVKVFNSVKCGSGEHQFLQDKDFELTLKGDLVYIRSRKDGSEVITPITNTPWFTELPEPFLSVSMPIHTQVEEVEQAPSQEDTGGTPQKKAKRSKVVKSPVPEAE